MIDKKSRYALSQKEYKRKIFSFDLCVVRQRFNYAENIPTLDDILFNPCYEIRFIEYRHFYSKHAYVEPFNPFRV